MGHSASTSLNRFATINYFPAGLSENQYGFEMVQSKVKAIRTIKSLDKNILMAYSANQPLGTKYWKYYTE